MTLAIRTLHLTNGSSIVPLMQEAGIEGTIVPWNDLLHEGPVPSGLGVAALRDARANFLAGCGWGSRDEILRDLAARDAALDSALGGSDHAPVHSAARTRVDEIVLWFEHDLYDQLQLIQILERLPVDGAVRLTAVGAPTYLGELPATEYPALYANRSVLTSAEQLAARDAWQAFRSSDPRDIVAALPRVTALPHLAPALLRHLQQFPSVTNGLSRTEQQTLEVIASGVSNLREVYVKANHDREEAKFMGDAGFLAHISALLNGSRPLIGTLEPGTLEPRTLEPWNVETLELSVGLTPDGLRVMNGELDRVAYCGIDRWLGGVHLSSAAETPIWRWDAGRRALRVL